eukprot:TRINITY_DN5027_c0_g1_i1.p2 TRINITY_DN5027_c0_g1~~TRINITY_DN5027_c0_g1_i1.p2  ORF type:complete len:492 (+),score=132.89 TRINITY_DN5027_c0_g1_i1:107-1582(+)
MPMTMTTVCRLAALCAFAACAATESCAALREYTERADEAAVLKDADSPYTPPLLMEIVRANYGTYGGGWRDVTNAVRGVWAAEGHLVISGKTVEYVLPGAELHVVYTKAGTGRAGWNTAAASGPESLQFFEQYGLSAGGEYGCAAPAADSLGQDSLRLAHGCGCGSIGACHSEDFIYHNPGTGSGHRVPVGACGCCATWFIVTIVLLLVFCVGAVVVAGYRRGRRKAKKEKAVREEMARDPEQYVKQRRAARRAAQRAEEQAEMDEMFSAQYGDHKDDWECGKAPKDDNEAIEQEVERYMRARAHRNARMAHLLDTAAGRHAGPSQRAPPRGTMPAATIRDPKAKPQPAGAATYQFSDAGSATPEHSPPGSPAPDLRPPPMQLSVAPLNERRGYRAAASRPTPAADVGNAEAGAAGEAEAGAAGEAEAGAAGEAPAVADAAASEAPTAEDAARPPPADEDAAALGVDADDVDLALESPRSPRSPATPQGDQ